MKYRVDKCVERKMRKLARRLAESNTWTNGVSGPTFATFGDVWNEAWQLIRLVGLEVEYDKRVKQLKRVSK